MPQPAHLPHWPLDQAQARFSAEHHGDYAKWQAAIDGLPASPPCPVIDGDAVQIVTPLAAAQVESALRALHPWRKGPWQVGDVHIDTEWRSDWKWSRLASHLHWQDKAVLDIGCGNGYFGWRMLAAGAHSVVGVDPTLLFCMQHRAIQHFAQHPRHWVLPLGIDELPRQTDFDITLSMGVIYHRRDPAAHVQHLFDLTRPGGQVVLESIVTTAEQGLRPQGRYARMRNVWYVPSVTDMQAWMQQAGGVQVACVDVTPTTTDEQRSTDWMQFESLQQALSPDDPDLTVEGHPAPVRAVVIATKAAD